MKCKDVAFGMGECAYNIMLPYKVKFPWEDDSKLVSKWVTIDKCLLPEILNLWEMGIKTTGTCCGHNKLLPFISVSEEFIPKMKEMGYVVRPHEDEPSREDNFIPKTLLNRTDADHGFNWWEI